MDVIVAVYDDWGIGKDGTQPIALSADRQRQPVISTPLFFLLLSKIYYQY